MASDANIRSFTASGNMYGRLLDSNKDPISGYVDMGDAWPFTLQVKLEQKSRKSSRKGMRGQTVDSGARLDEIVGSVGIKNWIASNIALLLSGEAVAYEATEASVTDQDITLPADGSWMPLGKHKVSAVTLTTADAADYEVNTTAGLIRNLTDAELVDKVAYTYTGLGGYKIDIGTQTVIRMGILIDGQNDETGEPIIAEFDSVVFIPNDAMTFISEPETDYEESLNFDLTFETLTGKTSPGTFDGVPV